MNRLRTLTLMGLLAAAPLFAGERINHEGRILGPVPVVTVPTLFNTPEADAIVGAMQIFPVDNALNEDISKRLPLSNSDAMIQQIITDLVAGHPERNTLRIFQEMNFVLVPDNQAKVDVNLLLYDDQSDDVKTGTTIASFPVPTTQPIESWPFSYGNLSNNEWQKDINNDGGDRHSITVQPGTGFIWETWMMKLTNNTPAWEAANDAKFNLNSNALRPDKWTSGDAAGLPMFAMIIRYDECERGMVEHAMRIVVKRSRNNATNTEHIYPATHDAGSTTLADVPAMGQRVRLKSGFQIPTTWSKQEKAVALALKKYGALVADNGNFFSISVAPDARFPDGCWDNLNQLLIDNFEVIQTTGPTEGPRSAGAPTANAGADQTVAIAAGATLSGTATGSGLTTTWYLYPNTTQPGTVTFGNAAALSTTATFSAMGTYTLMLKAEDGVHTPAYDAIIITVNQDGSGGGGGGGGSIVDDDGDGVSNTDEILAGTDPNSASSFPITPMTLLKVSGGINFTAGGKDKASASGVLPGLPALFNPNQVPLTVNIAGVKATFTLDAKGRAKSDAGSVSLRMKFKRNKATKINEFLGGDVPFSAKLSKGTFATAFAAAGFDNANHKDAPVPLTVYLPFNGKVYGATLSVKYSAKAGKSGRFKN
jgi:hypothetical protein